MFPSQRFDLGDARLRAVLERVVALDPGRFWAHLRLATLTAGEDLPAAILHRNLADLSLDDLITNETVFAETPVEVRARLSADGYANQKAKEKYLQFSM